MRERGRLELVRKRGMHSRVRYRRMGRLGGARYAASHDNRVEPAQSGVDEYTECYLHLI
jgi:hypothetical protein